MNFIKKHKKFVIIASIIFAVLLTLIIVIFSVFNLKEVTLKFKTDTYNISEEMQQEIINSTKSKGVATVLFTDKEKIISDLEKDFPYLKIVNIETVIPSGFIIHCAEREELYSVESNNKVYYLDEDLKILRIEEGVFIKIASNAVLLNISDLNLNIINAEAGQFLNFAKITSDEVSTTLAANIQKVLTDLLTAFEENNRDIAIIRAAYTYFKVNLKFQQVGDNRIFYVCLTLIDNTGFETEIVESNNKLAEKIELMISVVNELSSTDPESLTNKKLTVFENSSDKIAYIIK